MSVSFGGNKGKQKGTTAVDNYTQGYIKRAQGAAEAAGAAGPSPLVTDAADYYTDMQKMGNMGMGALSGDPAQVQAMMNPYQSQVMDGINAQWNKTDQQSMNAVNDRATQARAFGGSRHGIATGTALANNNMNRNQQAGGLLYGGFNDAMTRAGGMAGMGYNAAGQNANLGMGGVGNPDQWMAEMMKRYSMGPLGSQTHGSGYSMGAQAGRR